MAAACPEYRLRLFLSVDLVGSTAFKVRNSEPARERSPNPAWVDHIRHFYRRFPDYVHRAFDKIEKPDHWQEVKYLRPSVWKTVGDEIIFCTTVHCLDHLAVCFKSFLRALEDYGKYLDAAKDLPLDVKAYGWIAAFPFPNVTVRVFDPPPAGLPDGTDLQPELTDEAHELAADKEPKEFDFLGKEIDAGFRAGRHCSADKLTMSLELAWLVTQCDNADPLKGLHYTYGGRQQMKGVLNDRPYPIISIDVERSATRKKVRQKEDKIWSFANSKPQADEFQEFLEAFMIDESVQKPWLRRNSVDTTVQDPPADYMRFKENWTAVETEVRKRSEAEAAAADAEGEGAQLDAAITEAAAETVERAQQASEDGV